MIKPAYKLTLFLFLYLASMVANLALPAEARVTLARIFSDGVILQKEKPVKVFGTALPGEVVTAELGIGHAQQVVGKDGRFIITLPPTPTSNVLELKVTGQNTVVVRNIRFGQVWLVAGEGLVDSSLQDEMASAKKYGETIDGDGDGTNISMPPNLMVFKPDLLIKRNPEFIGSGSWVKGTEQEIQKYSAIALLFGKELAGNIKEPVGIIQVSVPNTPLRTWISPMGLDSKTDSRSLAQKYMMDEDVYDKLWGEYKSKVAESGQAVPAAELTAMSSGVFNGMLASIVPFSLKGIVFCQGESDLRAPLSYKTLFPILIKDLRLTFNQEALPLVYVQMGAQPSQEPEKENDSAAASLRHTQFKARIAPRVFLVVSSDLCREDMKTGNIYLSAQELAKRIANTALAGLYHISRPYLSPVVEYVENEGEAIKVVFKNAGKGLLAKGPQPVKGFSLAGSDHKFFDAVAKIEGNTVTLECKYVKMPRFVRYGWGNNPILSIYSLDGMPACPYTNDR